MGQYFQLLNIDKRQHTWLGKFREAFPSGDIVFLTEHLRGYILRFPDDPFEGQWRPPIKTDHTKAGLYDLPVELKRAIFDELDDALDVFSLCVASSHLWTVGLPRFKEMYEAQAHVMSKSWAGDRIICLGDYADDLPKGMMTEAELAECAELDSNMYSALDNFCHYNAFNDRPFEWDVIEFESRFDGVWSRNPTLARILYKWANPKSALVWDYNLEEPWALRNLSKKVYVRADVLALRPQDVCGPCVTGMSFGNLVASRICWSSDPSMSMHYAENHDLHRGVWAGDRFDIVELSEVDNDWMDVSMEAKKELSEIWESVWGKDWEQIVVKYGL